MNRPHALWPAFVEPSRQGDPAICLESARGVHVQLADGRTLLDGTSGLWNTNLGYGNEVIAEASSAALRAASYLSTFRYENVYALRAAEALVDATAGRYERVLFSTSGGAANDVAMKLVRHFHALRGDPRRQLVVGLTGSYHGLTYGSLALSGDDLGQQVYGVDRRLIRHVAPNDVDDLAQLLERQGDRIAAVVVEPVLGSGAIPLGDQFVRALLTAREEHGFVLVADEVATGFGRTGALFASELWAQQPDVLITSKGLTNGTCAASAVLVSEQIARTFHDSGAVLTHGETQAGTPVAAAAIIATLQEMRRLDAVEAGRVVARELDRAVCGLIATRPEAVSTRGAGCFRAVEVTGPGGQALGPAGVTELVEAIRADGAIVHPGIDGIQLIPALTSTTADVQVLLGCVSRGIERVASHPIDPMMRRSRSSDRTRARG